MRHENRKFRWGWLAGLALVATSTSGSTSAHAQVAVSQVNLPQIMAHPDWIARSPQNAYWADDGRSVYFWQKRVGSPLLDLVQMDLKGRELRRVSDEELGRVDVDGGDWSADRRLKVYTNDGDVFWKNTRNGEKGVRQLTRTAQHEHSPRLVLDNTAVAYRVDDLVRVHHLDTDLIDDVADLRTADEPADDEDEEDYLTRQQERLFDIIKQRKLQTKAREDEDEREVAANPARLGRPFYLGKKKEIQGLTLSPNGRWLLVQLVAEGADPARDSMPNYVAEDGYVASRKVRPKVGVAEVVTDELVLIDLVERKQHVLDLAGLPAIAEDRLAFLNTGDDEESGEEPEEPKEPKETKEPEEPKEPKPRAVSVAVAEWNQSGDSLLLQLHSRDNKDRWIASVELDDARVVPLHHLYDEAWINWRYNEMGWMPDGRNYWYLSEESGYSHLYVQSVEGGPARALTSGNFVVNDVQIDAKGRYAYFRANREHPGNYEIYRVRVESAQVEQISDLGGVNQARLSPDNSQLLIEHSEIDRPEELLVQPARPGREARAITDTISDEFKSIDWIVPEIVAIPMSHGRDAYAKLYRPRDETTQGRPLVMFVHGAGYTQNSHMGWPYYFREFMFHTLLVQSGYVVLDMDWRASAGYGRDWRTAIYRHMGQPELEDMAEGMAWAARELGVDTQRAGVYGGSYGGFLALMALFKEPDMFQCGAALRPVTDWAHYNHGYTSNILNTPELDPVAFERSSPIEFAAGLSRPLLMCHGMQDDNVVFQDTVRLAQRLLELEKEDWEVAMYPIEPHGFREPFSWLDEYRRIFKLFETHLKN